MASKRTGPTQVERTLRMLQTGPVLRHRPHRRLYELADSLIDAGETTLDTRTATDEGTP